MPHKLLCVYVCLLSRLFIFSIRFFSLFSYFCVILGCISGNINYSVYWTLEREIWTKLITWKSVFIPLYHNNLVVYHLSWTLSSLEIWFLWPMRNSNHRRNNLGLPLQSLLRMSVYSSISVSHCWYNLFHSIYSSATRPTTENWFLLVSCSNWFFPYSV